MSEITNVKDKLTKADEECKNKSNIITLVNKISKLHRHISYIYKFYIHCESFPIRDRIQDLMDRIETLRLNMESRNIIPVSENLYQQIESELDNLANDMVKYGYSTSIFTTQIIISKIKKLIAGIEVLLNKSESELKTDSKLKFFIKPHHRWHAHHTIEQCENLKTELNSSLDINKLKLDLLTFLIAYLKTDIENLPFKRIATISQIFKAIKTHETYGNLKDRLQAVISNIEYAFWDSKELSQAINKILSSHTEISKATQPTLNL